MFGVLADIGMNLLGNIFAGDRQEDAQGFSADQGATQRQFNSAEAIAQRDWQERMSSTAVQRHAKDLAAAGFNPLLSIHPGGGASTPTGAQASSGIPSAGIASPGGHAGVAAGLASASQVQVNEAAADKLRAEADEVRARTPRHEWDIKEIQARIPVHQEQVKEIQQKIVQSSVEIERIWQDVTVGQASAKHIDQQVVNLQAALPHIKAQIANLQALTAQSSAATAEIKQRVKANLPELQGILHKLEASAARMKQPGQANEAAAADSFLGQFGSYLNKINPLKGWLQ